MRKKTIKYYFFNKTLKNPAMQYLFCFSKKAFKQNKQQIKIKKQLLKKKKLRELLHNYTNFTKHIKYKLNYNQWNLNKPSFVHLFFKSYFYKICADNKIYNQINLWLLFKNKSYTGLKKQINLFPKTGLLSSHYAHILSKKNMTYQTHSKYRSKLAHLNFFSYYLYFFTKCLYTYNHTLNNNIYHFSTNQSCKSIWINEDFNVCTSFWNNNTLKLKQQFFYKTINRNKMYMLNNFNFENYNAETISLIYKNKDIIKFFFNEEDAFKKQTLKDILIKKLEQTPNSLTYIISSVMFIQCKYTQIYKCNLKYNIDVYIKMYIYFYNK